MLHLICFSILLGYGQNPYSLETRNITYEELLPLVEAKKVVLIDIREPKELNETGWIPGAINIPSGEFREALQMSELQFKEKYGVVKPSLVKGNVVIYCRSGRRVANALNQVADANYNLLNYSGSILDWQAHGGPLQH